ncbi:MAG: Ig-like domain-containing protein [Deltaproteobacteria bacterium]|jgi:hypothetical protein|nr:Ig-like domain-containing protein [Deltaproteobacteria bacterium]
MFFKNSLLILTTLVFVAGCSKNDEDKDKKSQDKVAQKKDQQSEDKKDEKKKDEKNENTKAGSKDTTPPKVVSTFPQNGVTVNHKLTRMTVKFNEPMMDNSWSWAYEKKETFPELKGKPFYNENKTKNTVKIKLEPNQEYTVWINTSKFKNFKDKAGNPAKPYKLTFKTK